MRHIPLLLEFPYLKSSCDWIVFFVRMHHTKFLSLVRHLLSLCVEQQS